MIVSVADTISLTHEAVDDGYAFTVEWISLTVEISCMVCLISFKLGRFQQTICHMSSVGTPLGIYAFFSRFYLLQWSVWYPSSWEDFGKPSATCHQWERLWESMLLFPHLSPPIICLMPFKLGRFWQTICLLSSVRMPLGIHAFVSAFISSNGLFDLLQVGRILANHLPHVISRNAFGNPCFCFRVYLLQWSVWYRSSWEDLGKPSATCHQLERLWESTLLILCLSPPVVCLISLKLGRFRQTICHMSSVGTPLGIHAFVSMFISSNGLFDIPLVGKISANHQRECLWESMLLFPCLSPRQSHILDH